MDKHTMTQKDAATLLGITQRTIARYRQRGLLSVRRDELGRPYYDPAEVEALAALRLVRA